jgi:Ca-activated chloride channel homolog
MRSLGLAALLLTLGLVGCANRHTVSGPAAPGSAPIAVAASPDPAGPNAPQPEPDDGEPVNPDAPWLQAATASDFILAHQPDQVFGVWVDVPKGAATGHVPTALTLTIDTSGSMRGDKIEHARDAARRLVEELEDGDRVAIVTFSDRARVLQAPTTIDMHTRRHLLNVIEELSADGGTAMFEGLKVAESQLWSTPDTHLVRRMVVISDGKATVGPTAPEELGSVAEVGLQRGIQVTSIGVGLDYDETTLNELSIRSSGRLYHVEHSRQLPGIVEQEIALLDSTAAADAQVEIVPAPGVTLVGADATRTTWSGTSLLVPLGTMFAGQGRELLVRARVDGADDGSRVLASVRLHFRDPSQDGVSRVQEQVLRATLTTDPSLVAAHENHRTKSLMASREATTFAQLASARANAGDFDAADLELERAEKKLAEQAKLAPTMAGRARAEESQRRISRSRKDLAKAKKAPKPAAAEASRKAALDLNDAAMDSLGY